MLTELKMMSLEARKAKAPEAGFLTTFLAEVRMRAKDDGNREPTESDMVKVAQRFQKSAEETKSVLEKAGKSYEMQDMELAILEKFLPKAISDEETKNIVLMVMQENNAVSMKDMGTVMAVLRSKYGHTIDMKKAGEFFKEQIC